LIEANVLPLSQTANCSDWIPACDGQTDRWTSRDGIVRAMHTRRAVKTKQT